MIRCHRAWCCVLVLWAASSGWAQGLKITQPVSDWAGVIDGGTEKRLEELIWELKQKTAVELAVVTVRSTDGVPIEEFALGLAERSGLGDKGRDDGCLILVAVSDRAYRVEVGYGLEGVLPDGFVGGVGRRYFVPYFKAQQYAEGIEQGTLAIAFKIADDRGVTLTGVSRPHGVRSVSPGIEWAAVLIVVGAIILSIVFNRWSPRRRGWMAHDSWGYRRGWGRGGGWSGGGFGGGGFGGGFGGGGGGFGGGGASGRW